MTKSYFAYVPENFYPERVLPCTLTKFVDDTRYFTHKIYEQRVFGARSKEDFIPLKAQYLRKIISFRKYQQIKNFLLDAEVLETDGRYVKGQKATGFRLGENYRGVKHKKVEITCSRLLGNLEQEEKNRKSKVELDVHTHLYDHLKTVEIDYDAAVLEIGEEDFVSNHISIEMIRDKNWFFHPDIYGRVHTNLTNLKSSIRPHLTVDNKKLKELDIANSQPFFFGVILLTYLLNSNKLTSFNPSLPPITPSLRCDIPDDAAKYLELVQAGELYEHLANKFEVPIANRRAFKVKLFAEVFFCRNIWKSKNADLFAQEFPTVYAVIRELKKKDYTALSKLLQKVESSFIINKVVRRLMNLNSGMFVGTIHDSLLIHEENAGIVQQIIREEFEPWGLIPMVKVK